MTVYIVTGTFLGWDCVVGVWLKATVDRSLLDKQFPEDKGYVISERQVESSLEIDE